MAVTATGGRQRCQIERARGRGMKLDPMAVCVSFEWRGKEKAGGATTVTVAGVVCIDRQLADGGVGANE